MTPEEKELKELEELEELAELERLEAEEAAGAQQVKPSRQPVPNPNPYEDPDAIDTALNAFKALGAGALDAGAQVARSVPILGSLVEDAVSTIDPEVSARMDAVAEESPVASRAAQFAGSMLSPIPGLQGAGVANKAANIGKELGVSAADATVRGDTDDLGQRLASEAGIMSALGAGGKLAQNVGESLGQTAGKLAESAAGLDLTKSLRKKLAQLEATGAIEEGELGRMLLDEGVISAKNLSKSKVAKAATEAKGRAGADIGDIIAQADPLSRRDLAKKLAERMQKLPAISDTKEVDQLRNDLLGRIQRLRDNAQVDDAMSAQDALFAKARSGDQVNDFVTPSMTKFGAREQYGAFKEGLEEAVPNLAQYQAANKKFQAMKLAEEATENKAVTDNASGLSKTIALSGLAGGNMALPAAVAGRALWKSFGGTLAASGLNKAHKFGKYSGNFAEASSKGPEAVRALHFMLMQDDPEYAKANSKEDEEN